MHDKQEKKQGKNVDDLEVEEEEEKSHSSDSRSDQQNHRERRNSDAVQREYSLNEDASQQKEEFIRKQIDKKSLCYKLEILLAIAFCLLYLNGALII